MALRFLVRVAGVAVLIVVCPTITACADGAAEKTWTDGICTYNLSPPLEGYLVPPNVFQRYDVPLEKVLSAAQRMSKAQLEAYARGGDPQVTREYPLFVFNNHGLNVFLWKGKHDGQQQIIPWVWDGESWTVSGHIGNPDSVEYVFNLPATQKRCYVMVQEYAGAVGHDRIHTDRVLFGALPPFETVFRKSIESADAVVYRPPYLGESLKSERLDLLKGELSLADLGRLPGVEQVSYDTFVFIAGTGQRRKIRSMYIAWQSLWRGEFGELQHLRSFGPDPPVAKPVMKAASMEKTVPLRWSLARDSAGARLKEEACRVRVVNPDARRGDWVLVELTIGRDQPGHLYRQPVTRSMSDGGGALVRFRVRRGDAGADLAPQGRFGADSLMRAAPEENAALGVEYQFIDCGEGVLKLALRPKEYPWTGTVQGHFEEDMDPFDRAEPPRAHDSEAVRIELN